MGKREKCRLLQMELEKLYRMPAFYVLLFFCIGFNLWMLFSTQGGKRETMAESRKQLETDAKSYEEEWFYDYYRELDFKAVQSYAKWEMDFDKVTAKWIARQYHKLEQRAEHMEEGEKNSLSFTGEYRLHGFLMGDYLRFFLMEGFLVIGLVVVYAMHFEQYHQTRDVTQVSYFGEELPGIKLWAAGIFAMGLLLLLFVVSFGAYFSMIDYSDIWNSYVSSSYNTDKRIVNDLYLMVYPYVTWWPMKIGLYFMASLGVALLLFLFVFFFTGLLAQKLQNSIVVLGSMVGIFFLWYLLGNVIMIPNGMEYVLKCNPIHVLTKCGYWFMDYAPGDSYPLYEIGTMGGWILLTGLFLRGTVPKKRRS